MNRKIEYLFTALATICCMVAAATPVFGGPAIQVVDPVFDFGKTLQHVKITHDFWIKSIGDETLVITKIVPGCGCTEAPLRDSVLAPGDSTVLSITFSTKSFAGKITKKPYLMTNISDKPVRLTIQAEVVIEPEKMAPLKIMPFEIDLAGPGQKDFRHAVFLIQNQGSRDLKLTLIDQPSNLFETSLPAAVKAGETVEAMVVVRKEIASADFEKSVTIEVNDNEKTRYSFPVSRVSRSAAEVSH